MNSEGTEHLAALLRALQEAATNARALGGHYRQENGEQGYLGEADQRLRSIEWLREQAQVYAQELARLYRHQRGQGHQLQEALAALEVTYLDAVRLLVAALELRDPGTSDTRPG